jgi:hypothetical protein
MSATAEPSRIVDPVRGMYGRQALPPKVTDVTAAAEVTQVCLPVSGK